MGRLPPIRCLRFLGKHPLKRENQQQCLGVVSGATGGHGRLVIVEQTHCDRLISVDPLPDSLVTADGCFLLNVPFAFISCQIPANVLKGPML